MDRDTQERIAAAQREAEQRTAEARAAEERAAEATRRAAEAARAAEERAAEASRVTETARVSEQRGIEAQQQREPLAHKPLERTVVPPPAPQKGLFSTISGWLQGGQPQRDVSVKAKKIIGSGVATRPAAPSSRTAAVPARRSGRSERKPRLLMLERRRGSADTVIPRLRQRGVEVQVVERWIDAVDEIFRFQPDAFTLDSELPDFAKIYKTLRDQRGSLPLFVTGRSMTTFTPPSDLRFVSFVGRPYDPEELANVARDAAESPAQLLARQAMPRSSAPLPLPVRPRTLSTPMPLPVTPTVVVPTDSDATPVDMGTMEVPAEPQQPAAVQDAMYDVACFNCRVTYDATDADWCSCLTKERTLVCTNCLTCFCKAPPSYKEKFWIDAPARLFEKKTAEARRHQAPLGPNPHPSEVKRPLVLTVEDDEDIRVIVQRVCSNLNYGFVHAENGQDGLAVAREYRPNLILSDAFMPKLDGREMCRILRDDLGADVKMVVMTGLYTDTKYRSEALKRFKVDDYLSKPVAITELVNLLQRHLEGVMNLPEQEDLHALHRQAIPAAEEENLALADVLDFPTEAHGLTLAEPEPDAAQPAPDAYEVCCHQCNAVFDAVKAEWCTCLGRDQTLACPECGSCFCKAAAAYKEKFWMDAPSSLFERKMIGSKRNVMLRTNPETADVKRPLILLVEDDENIQLIVRTVVTSMGFGFIVGANGQEGLALAREYLPDLILSDAFMPKLDGREMCRLLKSDPSTARIKAIIMTGLYTDRKYRSEALDYFKVDDYVAKPLAVDDLIKLFKKHLPQEVHQTM
jgi:CheY-like chemotaxis protein